MNLKTTYIVTRKLYSHKGTLLGTVNYPEEWDERIQGHRGFRMHWMPATADLLRYIHDDESSKTAVRTFVIHESYHERGAVEIYGVTPEEFEQMPDCSFSPGAAYIRSLIG
jgi:hypothetical protein